MLHRLRTAAKHHSTHDAGDRHGPLATLRDLDDDPVLLCDCPHGSCATSGSLRTMPRER